MKSFSVLLLHIMLTLNVFAQGDSSKLEGKWESVDINNQRGILLHFDSGNVFTLNHILAADYTYEIKKDMLISTLKNIDSNKTIIDTSFLIIKTDTIIRYYNRLGWKDSVIMIKTGLIPDDSSAFDNPIAGTWRYRYPTGDTAFSTFYSDGRWHFYLPMDKFSGTYTISRDTLVTNFEGSEVKQKRLYWIEGNLLGLKDINAKNEYLYRRLIE
ncbi:MAG TPA: hypothetical protein VI230_09130 [Ignavibacteriaceae bacterium]